MRVRRAQERSKCGGSKLAAWKVPASREFRYTAGHDPLDNATAEVQGFSRVPSHVARTGDIYAEGQGNESGEGDCPCVACVGDVHLRVRCDRHPAVT